MSSRHLVIGGTGRAGTSFLVRFLDACGLDTAAETAPWAERARAGGESVLDPDADPPYVVKDTWLWTYCESVDLERLSIDALVVPVRDLMDAAGSRVLQERAAMSDMLWVEREDVDVFGITHGGVVYSLSVADQARILAVGFHRLLQWAVRNEIRTVLLDFPRIVEDGDYLVSSLWPFLEGRVDRAAALAAFARVADANAVRVRSQERRTPAVLAPGSADSALDREALVLRIRELQAEADGAGRSLASIEVELADARACQAELERGESSLRAELDAVRSQAAGTNEELHRLRAVDEELHRVRAGALATNAELDRLRGDVVATDQELHMLRAEVVATNEELAKSRADAAAANEELAKTRADAVTFSDELTAMRGTMSWRITRPLRAIRCRSSRRR